ncbi:MAG: SMP-30/gluconolactonase/LRE family protein [Solirubrobacteraceae bacterium]
MGTADRFPQPDVLIPAEASVGEGPVIDQRTGRLCWVDIVEGALYENDLTDGRQTLATLGTMLGAVAPRKQADGFAVAVADGFGYWASGQLEVTDPLLPAPHRRMNDAKCDSRGRLWAGSTHMQFVPGVGALHRWDGGPSSVTMAGGLTLPNGLGWNHEDTIMYLIDSMNNSLLSASFDPDEGKVGQFSILCTIDPGLPDGLAVDLDGSIWVAVWGGAEVRRFDRTGKLIGIVPIPVTQPASCAFGPDGTLYITTARSGLSPEDLASQPHAGSVFALQTNTLGVAVRAFAA